MNDPICMDGHNCIILQYCDMKNIGQQQHSETTSQLNSKDVILIHQNKTKECVLISHSTGVGLPSWECGGEVDTIQFV